MINDIINEIKNDKKEVNKNKKILVLGDSHANDIYTTLSLVMDKTEYGITKLQSECAPLTMGSIEEPLSTLYERHLQPITRKVEYCEKFHRSFLNTISDLQPDLILFSESWRYEEFPYLAATISELAIVSDAKIVVFGRPLKFFGDPRVVFNSLENADELNKVGWLKRNKAVDHINSYINKIALKSNATYITKYDLMCKLEECDLIIDNEITYVDAQHWSRKGMTLFGNRLINSSQFKELL